MKKFLLPLLGIAFLSACNNTTNDAEDKTEIAEAEQQVEYHYYGDTINPDGAVEAKDLMAMFQGKDSLSVKVKGTVTESCKMKGCWMKMDLGNGQQMRVSFKDYGFFVPKNLNGETAVMEGYATMDTTSVADLKHYAQDAGKSQEEIDAITEPEISLTYEATGVIIQ